MIQLNLFETSIIKFDHLVADTPRQAYYKVWLESLMGKYLVRKESGTKKHTLDKRIWKFDDFVRAEKFYIRKVKEKTSNSLKKVVYCLINNHNILCLTLYSGINEANHMRDSYRNTKKSYLNTIYFD